MQIKMSHCRQTFGSRFVLQSLHNYNTTIQAKCNVKTRSYVNRDIVLFGSRCQSTDSGPARLFSVLLQNKRFGTTFHLQVSRRYILIPAAIPNDLNRFLSEFLPHEYDPKCKNEGELEERAETLIHESIGPFYRQSAQLCSVSERKRLPWFRNDAINWSSEVVPRMEHDFIRFVHTDVHLQTHVDKVLTRLIEAERKMNPAANCEYRIRMINLSEASGDGQAFQAASYPNGVIHISPQYVKSLSDNKLAFVLGRQMAHVIQHHMAEVWSVAVFCSLIGHYGSKIIMDSIDRINWTGETHRSAKTTTARDIRKHFLQLLTKPGHIVPGNTIICLEADKLALRLSNDAGFDPKSAGKVLMDRHSAITPSDEFTYCSYNRTRPIWGNVNQMIEDLYKFKDMYNQGDSQRAPEPQDRPASIDKLCQWTPETAERRERQDKIEDLISEILYPGAGRVASWGNSFDDLINDELGLHLYRKFLRSRKWEHQYILWEEFVDYRRIQSKKERERRAEEIRHNYVTYRLHNLVPAFKVDMVENWLTKQPTETHFDEAAAVLYRKLKIPYYNLFLASDLYQKHLRREKKGKQY